MKNTPFQGAKRNEKMKIETSENLIKNKKSAETKIPQPRAKKAHQIWYYSCTGNLKPV